MVLMFLVYLRFCLPMFHKVLLNLPLWYIRCLLLCFLGYSLARLVQHYNVQSLFQTVVFKEPEHEYIFAKGGDRKDRSCMPQSELIVCEKYGIEVVYGVGGFDKKNSSSAILDGLENNPSRIVTRSGPLPSFEDAWMIGEKS